jgi:hypothetical protein
LLHPGISEIFGNQRFPLWFHIGNAISWVMMEREGTVYRSIESRPIFQQSNIRIWILATFFYS